MIVRHANGFKSPYRCDRHRERNPCAIEGCQRTGPCPTFNDGRLFLSNADYLCGEHWRRHCPPRSKTRRAYRRFWRIAKRQATAENPSGWTPQLRQRFDLFWRALIARARRRATDGFVDEAEIAKMMGWD